MRDEKCCTLPEIEMGVPFSRLALESQFRARVLAIWGFVLGPVLGSLMRPAFYVNDRTSHERKLVPSDVLAYSPDDFGKKRAHMFWIATAEQFGTRQGGSLPLDRH